MSCVRIKERHLVVRMTSSYVGTGCAFLGINVAGEP